jgi:hypothetical protein
MKNKIFSFALAFLVLLSFVIAQEDLISEENEAKIIIIDLHLTKDRVITENGVDVIYGSPSLNIIDWGDLGIKVLSTTGDEIQTFSLADPSAVYYEDSGVEYLEEVNFEVVIPFQEKTEKLEVYDGLSQELLISLDLTSALIEFCGGIDYENDAECLSIMSSEKSDLSLYFWIGGGIIVAVILIYLFSGSKKKSKPSRK